ncbi:MAG TPA: ABC transporter permease [Candidatus Saccharimonadales bacterium]
MIRFREATMLALTKLRTRKVRLAITIVVSGLLFSALAGASMVSQGVFSSLKEFGEEGLADRYIVRAVNQSKFFHSFPEEEIVKRAKEIHAQTVARKQAEAKRLGVEYSPTSERSPVEENGTPSNLQYDHPAVLQAISEYRQQHPAGTQEQLKGVAGSFGATKYFQSRTLPYDLDGAQLKVLNDGKESFSTPAAEKALSGATTGTETFVSSWTLQDSELLEPFILPGQNLKIGSDGSMPVIVPLSAAEQLAHVEPLPSTASAKQRLNRVQEIRKAVEKITFDVCYRNPASAGLIDQALSVQKEIADNKDKKDYRQPDLVYALPADACSTASVSRDVRSAEQRVLDAKQQAFDEAFGEEPASQSKLRFRVVGIVPDPEMGRASIGSMISSLANSSLGSGWYTPLEQGMQQPIIKKLFTMEEASVDYMVEFPNAASARIFIEKEECQPDFSNFGSGDSPMKQCIDEEKFFTLSPYGSNSLALESARRGFNKILTIAALVVAGIACLIMMGIVGKMVADSRRETAVFRAIGAKKLDIAQIYLLYTVYVSLLISSFALLLGFGFALLVHARWSEEVTQHALLAYNLQDINKVFYLYGLNFSQTMLLIGVTVAACLLSAAIPIVRSLRRNPIRDMRDDT